MLIMTYTVQLQEDLEYYQTRMNEKETEVRKLQQQVSAIRSEQKYSITLSKLACNAGTSAAKAALL